MRKPMKPMKHKMSRLMRCVKCGIRNVCVSCGFCPKHWTASHNYLYQRL
jgi:hypothetical protein